MPTFLPQRATRNCELMCERVRSEAGFLCGAHGVEGLEGLGVAPAPTNIPGGPGGPRAQPAVLMHVSIRPEGGQACGCPHAEAVAGQRQPCSPLPIPLSDLQEEIDGGQLNSTYFIFLNKST